MRSSLALLLLGLSAKTVMSACAGDNALATVYGLTGLSANAAAAVTVTTPMAVCGFATTDPAVCCTETQITTTIKTYVDTLKTTLETAAGVRDKYIIEKRGDVIDVLDSLRRINAASSGLSDAEKLIAGDFLDYSTLIAKDFSTIVSNFDDYQEARVTCMNALLKTEAAIACASCLATAPTGVTIATPAVSLDDTLIAQINTACYNYIDYSERQSAIIVTAALSSGLASFATALENYVADDLTNAATNLAAAYTAFNKVTYSTTNAQKPVSLPASCSTTSCATWIESTLFSTTGAFSNDVAIAGGTTLSTPAYSTSRVLAEEGNERRLAASGWVQDLDDITYTIAFETNPGDVDNTENANSALRNGMTACAVAALALLF